MAYAAVSPGTWEGHCWVEGYSLFYLLRVWPTVLHALHHFTLVNALRLRLPYLSACRGNRLRVTLWPASEVGSELTGPWVQSPPGDMALPGSRRSNCQPHGRGLGSKELLREISVPLAYHSLGLGVHCPHAVGPAFSTVLMVQGPCVHAPFPRQPSGSEAGPAQPSRHMHASLWGLPWSDGQWTELHVLGME